jgi:hypothetical protein
MYSISAMATVLALGAQTTYAQNVLATQCYYKSDNEIKTSSGHPCGVVAPNGVSTSSPSSSIPLTSHPEFLLLLRNWRYMPGRRPLPLHTSRATSSLRRLSILHGRLHRRVLQRTGLQSRLYRPRPLRRRLQPNDQ